jgi:DNA-binding NarL/FixJ family response regulator
MAERKAKGVSIMIVDDHPIVRKGLRMIIERRKDFSIVAEASSANEAIRIIGEKEPDVVIADISLEGNVNGLELVKAIRERYPGVTPLVLSMYDESLYAERAIRAGARGYVMKKEADETIITAIETVLSGELY